MFCILDSAAESATWESVAENYTVAVGKTVLENETESTHLGNGKTMTHSKEKGIDTHRLSSSNQKL
jgi:hypothetical protein